MTLLGPNEHDTRKLHAEVNQLVNQRLLLTTLGITVFGVVIAWSLPTRENLPTTLDAFTYAVAILLTTLLFLLFLLTHQLTHMLRIFTAYLGLTGGSSWEIDWSWYRHKHHPLGYTKPQGMVFLVLGVVSTAFPFVLLAVYPIEAGPMVGVVLTILVGALYAAFVSGMAFSGWFAKEKDINLRWKELNDSPDGPPGDQL